MVSRLVGLLLLVAGVFAGQFMILAPLQEAASGAGEVSYSIKSFVLVPLLVVAGLALVLGGSRVGAAFSGPPVGREQKIIVWVTMILAFSATGIGWWWFDSSMTALGYGH